MPRKKGGSTHHGQAKARVVAKPKGKNKAKPKGKAKLAKPKVALANAGAIAKVCDLSMISNCSTVTGLPMVGGSSMLGGGSVMCGDAAMEFHPPEGLPRILKGHLAVCASPLAQLSSGALTAWFEDAAKHKVVFQKADHIWVSIC